MRTTVSEKGQMTLPKVLRDRLGIRPGQTVDVMETEGRLVITKVQDSDPVDAVYGILAGAGPSDALLAKLRGDEPEAP